MKDYKNSKYRFATSMSKKSFRWFTSTLTIILILLTFWPTIRMWGLTAFDVVSIPVILLLYLSPRCGEVEYIIFLRKFLVGIIILGFGGLLSSLMTADIDTHFTRLSFIVFAYLQMLLIAYGIAATGILKPISIIGAFATSGFASAVVAILQGRYGVLLDLIPENQLADGVVQDWTRMTGLSEHPIEAGLTISYSILCMLLLKNKMRYVGLLAIPLMLISFAYTSSITAMFAIGIALLFILISERRYIQIIIFIIAMVPGAIYAYFESPLLALRIDSLLLSGADYGTLQDRTSQYRLVLENMDVITAFLGRGYSDQDLPMGLDVHNGVLQALYHFGVFGVLGQLYFLYALISSVFKVQNEGMRALLQAMFIVFISGYLTGPTFARRPVWLPLIVLSLVSLQNGRASHKDASKN